jgi:hypothetical protein
MGHTKPPSRSGFLNETGSEPCKRVLQNAGDSLIGLGMFVFRA